MPTLFSICAQQRRRGGAFDPLSLSPALWLDASDANTLYDATTGGSLVAADGAVARWEDKSGNARHATQATLASRPLRKTAIQNGRDVARFDGDNDVLEAPSIMLRHVIVAAKWSGGATFPSYNGIFTHGNKETLVGDISTTNYYASVGEAQNLIPTRRVDGTITNAISPFTSPHIFDFSANAGDGIIRIGRDRDKTGRNWNGDFYEILVFTGVLSTTDRQAVESYLAAKWGITLA